MNTKDVSISPSSPVTPIQIKLTASTKLNFCSSCNKTFSTMGNLRNHIMTIHENKRPFMCTFPGCKKSYSIESRLQTGAKPYVCKECGKAFNEKGNLKTHQRFHSDQRPFQCPHCSKTYKTNGHLKDHIEIQHLKIRKFSCKFCPKKFGRISTLKAHIRTHTGEKNYKCRIEGCGKCFAEKGNMEIHYKRHKRRLEKIKNKQNKKKLEISLSLGDENDKQLIKANNENAITRPSSNFTLYNDEFQILSTKATSKGVTNLLTLENAHKEVSNDIISESNSNFMFYEPEQEENEVNKIDLGYLDSLNELNFDFDKTFMMNFEK